MLDYSLHGDETRPSLLLLHAGGMTRREWDPFLSAFDAQFRVIVPTALGHGASPRVPELSLEALVASTLELLDTLGVERAHVAGSSMGGATALALAHRRPERVGRLVLYRSGYRLTPEVREVLERFATRENWVRWGLARWMADEHAPQGGPDAWIEVVRKVARALESAGPPLPREDLARIVNPTLLITGDRDDLVPLEDMVALYRALPKASLWVVPQAGHLMGMETWRRQAFESEILRFLTRPE